MTKHAILEQSLALFQKEPYESVTMRSIAEECGLSLGAFYYHFDSKEAIVLEFYAASCKDHIARADSFLQKGDIRLEQAMTWICLDRFTDFKSYQSLLRVLAQRLDPMDPVSPWHSGSAPLRKQSVDLFGRVVTACIPGIQSRIARPLARALWLHHMAIIAFWSFDRGRGKKNTETILHQSERIWKSLPTLLRIPGIHAALNLILAPLERFEKSL